MSTVDLLAGGAGAEVRVPFEGRTSLVVRRNRLAGGSEALYLLHVGPVGRNLRHAIAFVGVAMLASQTYQVSHGPPPFACVEKPLAKTDAHHRFRDDHETGDAKPGVFRMDRMVGGEN